MMEAAGLEAASTRKHRCEKNTFLGSLGRVCQSITSKAMLAAFLVPGVSTFVLHIAGGKQKKHHRPNQEKSTQIYLFFF